MAIALALCGCAASSGDPATDFQWPGIAGAYIPLAHDASPFGHIVGAATMIAGGIAVTNAHNYDLIDPARYIARVPGYDLIFFRADGGARPRTSSAESGERVRAYGQGIDDELRTAEGSVVSTVVELPPRPDCPDCKPQKIFTYNAPAGPGFSGGPVVDEKTGALVGITFAYDDVNGKRIMYAYEVNLVLGDWAELKR